MPQVEIYTNPFCPYCHRAKALLERKGVRYTEIDVMSEIGKRAEMEQRSNGSKTVPQIFIDGRRIGGFDDLSALDQSGKLDPLLSTTG